MPYERERLIKDTMEMVRTEGADILEDNAKIIKYYFENCEISVPEENRFFVCVNCDRIMLDLVRERIIKKYRDELFAHPLYVGQKLRAYSGDRDFGHTSPDWESVISLGIFGLMKRIEKYKAENESDKEKVKFYDTLLSVYESTLSFMRRAADAARLAGKMEMAEGIESLTKRAPENLYEAMQTTFIYYVMQQMTECANLRTLGRLDSLYLDFYNREEDKSHARELIEDFLREVDRLGAVSNVPFALGAPYSKISESPHSLTKEFLNAYRNSKCNNTKIHLLCRKDTPSDVIEEAFLSIREGNNSIIFMSDEKIIESLVRLGEDECDARDYHVVGCYECGAKDELTCSCNARLNLPRAVEYALFGGYDVLTGKKIGLENDGNFSSFDEFFEEFIRQMNHLANAAMTLTEYHEKHYREIYAAPILTSTYTSSLESGRELYSQNGAKYNNSSLNALGLATATDSLAAIRKLVFEDGEMTLGELRETLKNNWAGKEILKLRIINKFPRFGVGDKKTDAIASAIVENLSKTVNRRPNARSGIWRLGTFSIDWRWEFGKRTAASADGRMAGEPISQNTGATFGKDKNGMAAHMLSVCEVDSANTPNGTVLDLDVHISSAEGKSGMNALTAGLKTYFALGGFAVHYNILDTETLKKAKARPEEYKNLQVRLCGWNVLFSSLSEREKDEFIARFEAKS